MGIVFEYEVYHNNSTGYLDIIVKSTKNTNVFLQSFALVFCLPLS